MATSEARKMEKADIKFSELPFAFVPTDYNIRYRFKDGKWDGGELTGDNNLTLHMSATCFHYGQQLFEGLKVYERADGQAQLFRVEENARRMNRGAVKLVMEQVPEELFVEGVIRVVNANRRFIPPYGCGATLYVRPLLIGANMQLGVSPAVEYMLLIFVSPVGPYYKSGFTPVHLKVEENIDRAAALGVGDIKAGGNYAAGMRATIGAKHDGYNEVLYLDSKEKKYLDESGTSNFFGVTADNRYVTPERSSILPSITNMSVKTIAADQGMKVEARNVKVEELADFVEAGCCGTAAVISPVGSVTHRDKKYIYCKDNVAGPVCTKLYKTLSGIQFGEIPDPYGWTRIVPEK
jgi:branched-chain amino acid aminotransferase